MRRWYEHGFDRDWARSHPEGKADLCNANLSGTDLTDAKLSAANLAYVDLRKADLTGAHLGEADLTGVHLGEADLTGALLFRAKLTAADLRNADLTAADLRNADLTDADLRNADLRNADLTDADLTDADLSGAMLIRAILVGAVLTDAQLIVTDLTGAHLIGTDMTNANLRWAKLINANLSLADLTDANLYRTDLTNATVYQTNVTGARLAYADLTGTFYSPDSPPPDPFVVGIHGLSSVQFYRDEEIGLVQLRQLLSNAGLRHFEREVTYSIERGRTQYALEDWNSNLRGAAEAVFRLVAFDLTTAYGLRPGQALIWILCIWFVAIVIYIWPIYRQPRSAGIYQVWPQGRIEVSKYGEPHAAGAEKVERLHRSFRRSLGWSAYFSLLSAFHIGFREFSVGTWIARTQRHEYTLKATGWVRVISGIQSLLSVYLLAMWALTYFGRPFQ